MSNIFAGSNYGIISTINSGSGTLGASGSTGFNYENVQNYTIGTIFINSSSTGLTGTNLSLNLNYSNTISGTNNSIQSFQITNLGSDTFDFVTQSSFLKVSLNNNTNSSVNYTIQTKYNNSSMTNLPAGYLSPVNSKFITSGFAAGQTGYGSYESVLDYSLITIGVSAVPTVAGTVSPGTINCTFSGDGYTSDRIVQYSVQDAAAIQTTTTTSTTFNPVHTLVPVTKYFKVDYINGSTPLSSIQLSVIYHKNKSKPVTSRATQFITDYSDVDTSRNIVVGKTYGTQLPGGQYTNIGVIPGTFQGFGNLAVSIKDPVTSFGEILTANLTPITQVEFSQGQPIDLITIYQNNLSTTSYGFNNSIATIGATGTNTGITGNVTSIYLTSPQFIKYKSGQGVESRFSAIFQPTGVTGVSGSNQFIGMYNQEDSITFGYFYDTDTTTNNLIANKFAIRHAQQGKQQINRIGITGGPSTGGTAYVNFGSTGFLIGITASESLQSIASDITNSINNALNLNGWGWTAQYYYNTIGNTGLTGGYVGQTGTYYVDIIRNFSISDQITVTAGVTGTGAAGLNIGATGLVSGVSPTNKYYIQYGATGTNVDLWNLDRCYDQGSLQQNYLFNPSGFILDPTKGNIYRTVFQYLGFGCITCYIEQPNIGYYIPVNIIRYPNANVLTNFGDPSFRVAMGIENILNNNPIILKSASISSFVQGSYVPPPIYRSYGYLLQNNNFSTAPSTQRIIFGIRYKNLYQSSNSSNYSPAINYKNSRSNILLTSLNVAVNTRATTDVSNITFYLIKNPSNLLNIGSPNTFLIPPWTALENNLILSFNGITSSATVGYSYNGGTTVTQVSVGGNNGDIYDLTPLKIYVTYNDTYLITCDGSGTGTQSDYYASLSWYINQ